MCRITLACALPQLLVFWCEFALAQQDFVCPVSLSLSLSLTHTRLRWWRQTWLGKLLAGPKNSTSVPYLRAPSSSGLSGHGKQLDEENSLNCGHVGQVMYLLSYTPPDADPRVPRLPTPTPPQTSSSDMFARPTLCAYERANLHLARTSVS